MIPEHVGKYLKASGYTRPNDAMAPHIEAWRGWLMADSAFFRSQTQAQGRIYSRQRRSVHPAKRVCEEWASLLLNEDVAITTESEEANAWLAAWMGGTGFLAKGQWLVSRAFALGTGAMALWLAHDGGKTDIRVRRYDARMMAPLRYDEDEVTECAFVTKAVVDGKEVDQMQMHVLVDGTYHIVTRLWRNGKPYKSDSIIDDFDTMNPEPTFAIVKPATDNTAVDMSPFGQSIYADALDVLAAVDIAFDAVCAEMQLSKMRVFMGDLLFDVREEQTTAGDVKRTRYIPFGRDDAEVYRAVGTTSDLIQVFAPPLRSADMLAAYRAQWQTLGDLCGFGVSYFDVDKDGGIRTATEVSSDNSQLMRSIRKHENALTKPLTTMAKALIHAAVAHGGQPRTMLDWGEVRVTYDDSIITDTQSEKQQDLREMAAGVMRADEYRVKWYGETAEEAAAALPGMLGDLGLYG